MLNHFETPINGKYMYKNIGKKIIIKLNLVTSSKFVVNVLCTTTLSVMSAHAYVCK
jgi:hypothetical protein